MFRINRRTDYAIRVLLCLAKRPFGTRLPTSAIQDEMRVPHAFLQRIIAELSRAGLIGTYPGPSGGIQLARPAESVDLLQVWEAIEGPLLISDCLDHCEDCPLGEGCPVTGHWGQMQAEIRRRLESTRLDQLAGEAFQIAHNA